MTTNKSAGMSVLATSSLRVRVYLSTIRSQLPVGQGGGEGDKVYVGVSLRQKPLTEKLNLPYTFGRKRSPTLFQFPTVKIVLQKSFYSKKGQRIFPP